MDGILDCTSFSILGFRYFECRDHWTVTEETPSMTTIAYKDGIIACDSAWSYNGGVSSSAKKLIRLRKSGALIGLTGGNDVREVIALFERITTVRGLPSYGELAAVKVDSGGLLILPPTRKRPPRIFKFSTTNKNLDHEDADDLGLWEISLPIAAAGSGGDYATGAMAAGKTAAQAVAIACRWDMASKPPVHWVKV